MKSLVLLLTSKLCNAHMTLVWCFVGYMIDSIRWTVAINMKFFTAAAVSFTDGIYRIIYWRNHAPIAFPTTSTVVPTVLVMFWKRPLIRGFNETVVFVKRRKCVGGFKRFRTFVSWAIVKFATISLFATFFGTWSVSIIVSFSNTKWMAPLVDDGWVNLKNKWFFWPFFLWHKKFKFLPFIKFVHGGDEHGWWALFSQHILLSFICDPLQSFPWLFSPLFFSLFVAQQNLPLKYTQGCVAGHDAAIIHFIQV